MPTTLLERNPREGNFFLRITYRAEEAPLVIDRPGHVIIERQVGDKGLTSFAIQVKYPDGWHDVEGCVGTNHHYLARLYLRDWKWRQWKTRFVARHPDADNVLKLNPYAIVR